MSLHHSDPLADAYSPPPRQANPFAIPRTVTGRRWLACCREYAAGSIRLRLSVPEYGHAAACPDSLRERRQTMTGLRPDGCVRRSAAAAPRVRGGGEFQPRSAAGASPSPPAAADEYIRRLWGRGLAAACSPPLPAAAR